MADTYKPYWAPYHKGTLVLWMTETEVQERIALIRERKFEHEIPHRLAAFQPVKEPDKFPASVLRLYKDGTFSGYHTGHEHAVAQYWSAVTEYFDLLEAQRQIEYPDTIPYDPYDGLVFPYGPYDGLVFPDKGVDK